MNASSSFLANLPPRILSQAQDDGSFLAWHFDGVNQIGEKVKGATRAKAIENLQRIELERPANGIQIPTRHPLEIAAFKLPNGATHVVLEDDSEKTWEAYCAQIRAK